MISKVEKKGDTGFELTSIIQTLSREVDGALSFALNAQLEVLQVLKDPSQLTTCVDTVLQHLLHGMELASSDHEIKLLRKDSGLLIQSLLFVTQAELIKESQQNKKELIGLLTQATNCSLNFIELMIPVIAMKGVPAKVQHLSATVSTLKQNKNSEKNSFIEAIYKSIFNFFQRKKDSKAYYKSIDLVYDKLFRYKDLVGTSIILAESVRNNSDSLIEHNLQEDKDIIEKMIERYHSIKY